MQLCAAFGNPTQLRDRSAVQLELELAGKISARSALWCAHPHPLAGFCLTAILVMALGIGATTSLFTIVRSVLLKPLPFRDPDNLVMVYEHFRETTAVDGFNVVSPADFNDWHQRTHGFADMAAWHTTDFDLTGEHAELPEVVQGAAGSWNLFSVLGTPPAIGPRLQAGGRSSLGPTMLFCLRGASSKGALPETPSVIGKQIRLDSAPYEVIGVLPRWFTYPDSRVQVWVPYASTFQPADYAPA